MASADATTFPVKGQAFRLAGVITSASTLNPIAAGTLTTTISKDGAAFGAPAGAGAVQIGTTGFLTIDLSAADMNANSIIVNVASNSAGAVNFTRELVPEILTEPIGRWDAQTVIRYEQCGVQTFAVYGNEYDFLAGGTCTIKTKGGGQTMLSHTYAPNDTGAIRGQSN